MDKGYEQFCLADPVFYDSATVTRGDDVDFEIAGRPVPDGWERIELDDWLVYQPEQLELPAQGWKIHASAAMDSAEEILAAVWDYCIAKRVAFKFVRSRTYVFLRNMKYAHRGSSGKFITIYPLDERQLETVLSELGAILEGQPGPYILSDLRWGAGPLYVRYGGFAERYCVGADGEPALAIADGDEQLIPDRRDAAFHVPPWVTLPEFLVPHLEARNATTLAHLPYTVERPLHFSNGGGVYAGVDRRSGEQVVLKEARPFAGLAIDEADAVTRLARERDMLERLAGLDVVPRLRDHFVVGDHHFLVQDFVEGSTLSSLLVERYPLTSRATSEAAAADYAGWALAVYDRVERLVDAVHERGVVIGDLHPANLLVRPDGRVVLIDFEIASLIDEGRRPTMGDPSFIAPPDRSGFEIDRYALAALRLFLFMPLTTLMGLDPRKAEELAVEIAAIFPVPQEFLADAVSVITAKDGSPGARTGPASGRRPAIEPDRDGWLAARDSMARAIRASATPERDDRLFPGDVRQFTTGGLNIAYGAAGVLYALAVTGCERNPDHEHWLVERARHPERGTSMGFYDGLSGVAHVLECLDRRDDALAVMEICTGELDGQWDRLGQDLRSGLAGLGLNLLHFAEQTGDPTFRATAEELAEIVADRLGDADGVPETSGGRNPYAGLLRGSSGPALFFIRLYEQTGEGELLELARTALRQDLRRCRPSQDDSLEVNEGWRTMPYLADGSIGIGMVLADYLQHRDDDELAEAATRIRRVAEAQFYVEPGLFYGRAGMILSLAREHPPGSAAEDPIVAAQARRLAWHALSYEDELAFPGEQLMRLSMDLGTGTAGVLLALGAALHDEPVQLPFLASSQDIRVAKPGDRHLLVAERG